MASHGILNPNAGAAHFTLDRIEPAHDFAALVERYWLIRWSLRGDETFAQETLPHPCVNVVIGTHRPGVHGIGTKRFIAELSKTGWVFGIKFRPGAFRVVYERDTSELTGREKSIASVFGDAGASVEGSVLERGGGPTCVELVEPLLRRFVPIRDENVALAARAVDLARAEPSIGRARDLAERVRVSPRSLERLFGKCVGVPPKWIIRRYRVHEACERVRSGARRIVARPRARARLLRPGPLHSRLQIASGTHARAVRSDVLSRAQHNGEKLPPSVPTIAE